MNLIADIAEMAGRGFTTAKMAIELEARHAVQVSEAWLEHIMGADGFHAALAQARERLAAVDAEIKNEFTAAPAQAEGGESDATDSPMVVSAPAPQTPETKAADDTTKE